MADAPTLTESPTLSETVVGERLRIVAALARHFNDLDLAEEAFAEACLRAANQTSQPRNWSAWLYRVALRVAIDRRRRLATRRNAAIGYDGERIGYMKVHTIPDHRLAMIFACCHPAINMTDRIALTLTTICGLTVQQVSAAFLLTTAALSQRLFRAKRKLSGSGILFEIPDARFWPDRLEAVLSTIEIAYARGHGDAAGKSPEAQYAAQMIELAEMLVQMLPDNTEIRALAAALMFSEARSPARVNGAGQMVPLSEQDRTTWSHSLIGRANRHWRAAKTGSKDTARLIRCEIQALWSNRGDREETYIWRGVLAAYDRLLEIESSPFVHINRAVALAHVEGPESALVELDSLPPENSIGNAGFHAVRAGMLYRLERWEDARREYDLAIGAQPNSVERDWLMQRRSECLQSL